MGGFVSDNYVSGLLDQLNLRFAPGDAIKEMVALQKEFNVFSEDHALWESFALLNIGRMESWRDRRGWYRYLTSLRDAPSDRKGVKAHAYPFSTGDCGLI